MMEENRPAFQGHGDPRSVALLDVGPEFLERAFHLLLVEIGRNWVGEDGVDDLAMTMIHGFSLRLRHTLPNIACALLDLR